ncbi:MAG: hypothetical protein B6U69_00935 [Thermofilum sp. ex4484_15]|nr:MAG: hypothetical protein B6U69_00935 [Thermofilum sp. ex4484_15]
MGLGLIKVFSTLPFLRHLLVLLGIGVGSLSVINSLTDRGVKLILRGVGDTLLKILYSVVSPKGAFLCGLAVSFLLSPCTSGPYLAMTSLISRKAALVVSLILPTLYNVIFVSPFLGITLAMHYFNLRTLELKKFKAGKGGFMELVAGIALIRISIYALIS